MCTERKLILLAVTVGVLYAISLGLSSWTNRPGRNPMNSWVTTLKNVLPGRQKLDLEQDVKPASGLSNGVWTISNGAASLEIVSANRTMRKAKLSLEAGAGFRVVFEPRSNSEKPGRPLDEEAVPVTIGSFTSNRSPLELIFLRHGGLLKVSGATGMVWLKLE